MIVYTPDPPAFAARLREALTVIGEALRRKGAEVELIESGSSATHAAALLVTIRGSRRLAEATSIKLAQFGESSGATLSSTTPTPQQPSEGEYHFGLCYGVARQPGVRKRSRAA